MNEQLNESNFLSDILAQYGLVMNVGIVVVIVVFMILTERYINKKWHKQIDLLPLFISGIVVFFMEDRIHFEYIDYGFWYALKAWASETFIYMAGCFICYNLVYKNLVKDKIIKNTKK